MFRILSVIIAGAAAWSGLWTSADTTDIDEEFVDRKVKKQHPRSTLTTTTSTTTPSTTTTSITPSTRYTEPTSTTSTTTARVWTVSMTPNFEFGIPRKNHSPVPSDARLACPRDREYCIDTRYSGSSTCMHPSPLSVKICLDDSCRSLPANESIMREFGEDSYCKDFQIASGRVCHWTSTPCTCASTDLRYTQAMIVEAGEKVLPTYRLARICEYPDNYKAANLHENEQPASTRKPAPRQNMNSNTTKTTPTTITVSVAVLLAAFVYL